MSSDLRMMGGDSLATRAVSGFPVSIGTSLALETLFSPRQQPYDPERQVPERVDAGQYQECWINLTTLFRNLIGSVQKEVFLTVTEAELVDTLLMEMEVIDSLFQNEGGGTCRPRYYWCSYKNLKSHVPKQIKFREDKTHAQIAYAQKMERVLKLISKQTEAAQEFDSEIKTQQKGAALMISHVPYDLLNHRHFSKLSLLESHSGKLKNKNQWFSKYYPVGDADLSHMPFLRRLLMVFGDRVLIQPSDFKLRKLLVEIAQKRQWTPMTSDAMVIQGLELEVKEPYVLQFLKSL